MRSALKDLENYKEDCRSLEDAIISSSKNIESGDLTTAICYSHLATIFKKLGDASTAKELSEKATTLSNPI